MASGVVDQDGLQVETGLLIQDVQTTISMLEVQGRIAQDSVGNWRLL